MQKYLPTLINLLVRLFHITFRYKFLNPEILDKAKAEHKSGSYILGIWHQNLFAGITAQMGTPHVVIVSGSKDGELVAVTCEKFGNVVARGSSTRGGKKAMTEMIKFVEEGYPAAITIDGPKGPAKEVKPGIIKIAELTGAMIVPYGIYPEKFWSFNKAWDKFRLPKPFTRVFVRYGDPIMVEPGLTAIKFTEVCEKIKESLAKGEKQTLEELKQGTIIRKSLKS
jgi:lysophospholipid acyltransferase (LPLAT)-like uncharacterized protein